MYEGGLGGCNAARADDGQCIATLLVPANAIVVVVFIVVALNKTLPSFIRLPD